MLSLSLDALFKLSKTTSPQKLFDYDCITLYSKTVSLAESTWQGPYLASSPTKSYRKKKQWKNHV